MALIKTVRINRNFKRGKLHGPAMIEYLDEKMVVAILYVEFCMVCSVRGRRVK